VAADRHQAAADECHITGGIQHLQLAEGVDQQDFVVGLRPTLLTARAVAYAALAQQFPDLVEARRMSRHEHEQSVRITTTHVDVCIEQPPSSPSRVLPAIQTGLASPPHSTRCWRPAATVAAGICRSNLTLPVTRTLSGVAPTAMKRCASTALCAQTVTPLESRRLPSAPKRA
jgi:hypothetical protein